MYNHLFYQSGKILWPGILEYHRGYLFSPPITRFFPWFKISLYAFCMGIAFLIANYFVQKEIYRRKLPSGIADNIILIALFGGLFGAKIFYFFEATGNWSSLVSLYDLFFRYGGLTWYGGFIVAGLGIFLYLKVKKISPLSIADYGAFLLAFGYGMGRLGCMLSGDGCYGIEAPEDVGYPWAVAFPNGSAPWIEVIRRYQDINVRVYNTPLIEALISFSLAIFLYFARFLKGFQKYEGLLFFGFLFLHSFSRFVIEFWRLNEKIIFGLTQAQFISIIVVSLSLFYIVYIRWFRLEDCVANEKMILKSDKKK